AETSDRRLFESKLLHMGDALCAAFLYRGQFKGEKWRICRKLFKLRSVMRWHLVRQAFMSSRQTVRQGVTALQ
ncbi:hypothetical protein MM710_36440, partial [Klebsiella pneumoniae]|nr:hypothetical protein [Klebsiella pneumoniae]